MGQPRRGMYLSAAVLAHLAVTIAHGVAHAGANVALSRAASAFVYAVVLAGPLAGLALMRSSVRLGGSIVGATMAAALAFGIVNHFVSAGPDHVAHVAAPWRAAFAISALLLAVTEAVGVGLAVAVVRNAQRPS